MKKTVLSCIAAVGITIGSFGMITAQNSAQAPDAQSPAVYFSEHGDPLATIQVTSITNNWDGHSKYSQPEDGSRYVLVNFDITVKGNRSVTVEAYDFSVVDDLGVNHGRSYVSVDEGKKDAILDEDTVVKAGETTSFSLPFEIAESSNPSLFIWQPDSGILVTVPVADAKEGEPKPSTPSEATPSATQATPAVDQATPASSTSKATSPKAATDGDGATIQNNKGDDIATVKVADVVDEWDGYRKGEEPKDGERYVLVTYEVTNLSGGELPVTRFDFDLTANGGDAYLAKTVHAAPSANVEVFSNATSIHDGDTMTITLVYSVPTDVEPDAVMVGLGDKDTSIPLNP